MSRCYDLHFNREAYQSNLKNKLVLVVKIYFVPCICLFLFKSLAFLFFIKLKYSFSSPVHNVRY